MICNAVASCTNDCNKNKIKQIKTFLTRIDIVKQLPLGNYFSHLSNCSKCSIFNLSAIILNGN